MDIDCQSLSSKEINSSFSARKKKKKVLKNVLMPSKPQLFKSLRTASENYEAQLRTLLPLACINDLTNDTKEARAKARNSLCLGVNAVSRELQKQNICGVLFTADVNPEALVSHVIQKCCLYNVPMLKVDKFRNITYSSLGFECITLGFKKSSDVFKDLITLIYEENNLTMVEEVLNAVTVNESNMEVEEASNNKEDESVVFLEEKPQERVFQYFKRTEGSQRIFSPEQYNEEHGLLDKTCASNSGFISIQNQTFSVDDAAQKGISSTVLNSRFKPKKKQKKNEYIPAKVRKLGSNMDRKKKRQN